MVACRQLVLAWIDMIWRLAVVLRRCLRRQMAESQFCFTRRLSGDVPPLWVFGQWFALCLGRVLIKRISVGLIR